MLALVLVAAMVLDDSPAKPIITTTFYPTEYFASRLAGADATVRCPLPEDEDPAFWKPAREVVLEMQQSALVVVNGASFEKWVERANLPLSKTVDTCHGFKDEFIVIEHAITHSHGTAGVHSHEGIDGHTWLDPQNATRQAEAIAKGLERVLPGREAEIGKRLDALKSDLKQVEDAFRALGSLPAGEHLYCSHPAYNYLARRFAWSHVNFDLDPGEMPSDESFAAIKKSLETKPGRFMVWESTPKPEIAARLEKDCGLKSLTIEPCENLSQARRAAAEDYLTVQRANVAALKPAFAAR